MKGNEDVIRITKKPLKTLWKTIYVHINNHLVLRSYRVKFKISMTAVLHMLIGFGTKCFEEQHVKRIVFLEKQVSHMAAIIIA